MDKVSVKELLEAGAHFGHQTSFWHPKMKRYIFTHRNGIHIVDLEQTVTMLDKACVYVRDLVAEGKSIIFVSTKRQAQQIIEDEAKRCEMYYVNQRWLGGLLTNFTTIQSRIDLLVRLEDKREKGELDSLPKKETSKLDKKLQRLNEQMGGFKEMTRLPDALFIVDPTKDEIAFSEAKRLGIPVVSIIDTNCNPDNIDYPIPANDDAIKTIKLICTKIADAVIEGKALRTSQEIDAGETPILEDGEPIEVLGSYTFNPEED
jgi:small subunit ribosomal protein S2